MNLLPGDKPPLAAFIIGPFLNNRHHFSSFWGRNGRNWTFPVAAVSPYIP